MKEKFAAQLSTVRDEMEKDLPKVFRDLKAMGWSGVQISAVKGYTPQEVAAVLKETGLGTAGMHVGLERLQDDLSAVLEEAKLYNTKDVVCPGVSQKFHSEEGYIELRGIFNEIARKISPLGYRLSYHNHAHEFEVSVGGKSALEYLLEPSENNLLLAEIDVYWVKKGGRDPLAFLQPYSNRMPIIHLKDMTMDEQETFAEVATGSIDFAPILIWCEQNGVEWLAVEQDICPGNPMDSLQISLNNLNRLAEALVRLN